MTTYQSIQTMNTNAAFIPAALGTVRRKQSSSTMHAFVPALFTSRCTTPKRRRAILQITEDSTISSTSPRMSASESDKGSTGPASQGPESSDTNDKEPFPTLRVVLAGVSMIGAAESLYLTFNKVFSSPGAICATQGCLDVLAGPFSSFFGIPLSLFGALSYAVFAYLCIWPLTSGEEASAKQEKSGISDTEVDSEEEIFKKRDAATRPLLLALSTTQFFFSVYLMLLLKFVIKSMCPYCLASATISTSLFILTAFIWRAVPSWRAAGAITAASTTFTAIIASVSLMTSWPLHILAQGTGEPQTPPAITTSSTKDTFRLARKLKKMDSKMYGAFWCTHCYDQKQRFGKNAFGMLQYIECDKNGTNSQAQLCREKRVPGYPTWEINGELYPGEIDISELERLVDDAVSEAEATPTKIPQEKLQTVK